MKETTASLTPLFCCDVRTYAKSPKKREGVSYQEISKKKKEIWTKDIEACCNKERVRRFDV
jgi:hypothetical protein